MMFETDSVNDATVKMTELSDNILLWNLIKNYFNWNIYLDDFASGVKFHQGFFQVDSQSGTLTQIT